MVKINKIENKAYIYMKEHIQQKKWNQGMQVKELDVADQLGISRTPVRKALKRLEEEKLVFFKQNKGVYVSKQVLGLKEQKERIYFLEALLQHIIYSFQTDEIQLDADELNACLKDMEGELSGPLPLFEENEIVFWKTLLTYHSNEYMNDSVIITLASLYENSASADSIFIKSREIKISHYKKIVEYLSDKNYIYARREVRIMLNQLLINLIQGVE